MIQGRNGTGSGPEKNNPDPRESARDGERNHPEPNRALPSAVASAFSAHALAGPIDPGAGLLPSPPRLLYLVLIQISNHARSGRAGVAGPAKRPSSHSRRQSLVLVP